MVLICPSERLGIRKLRSMLDFPIQTHHLKEAPIRKLPNLKGYLNVNDARFWLASKGLYPIVDSLYAHMWKQLYAILIGCIGFFTCKNKAYGFLQMSFMESNSRVTCNKVDYKERYAYIPLEKRITPKKFLTGAFPMVLHPSTKFWCSDQTSPKI